MSRTWSHREPGQRRRPTHARRTHRARVAAREAVAAAAAAGKAPHRYPPEHCPWCRAEAIVVGHPHALCRWHTDNA